MKKLILSLLCSCSFAFGETLTTDTISNVGVTMANSPATDANKAVNAGQLSGYDDEGSRLPSDDLLDLYANSVVVGFSFGFSGVGLPFGASRTLYKEW